MKIVTKLNIALTATGFILFGTYAIYLEFNEEYGLHKLAEREIPLLGLAIHGIVENAVRENEISDIWEMLSRMDQVAPTVDIVVYRKDGRLLAESPGSLAKKSFEKMLAEKAASTHKSAIKLITTTDTWRGAVAFPLEDNDGSPLGAVVIARPLSEMQMDMSAKRMAIAVDVLLFVVLSSFLGWMLGRKYIGEPLNGLIVAMRQVRLGDLRSFLNIGSRDEVGKVASEFNIMVSELYKAREKFKKEHFERLHIESALLQADKLATIGQLAASLAHEIGSPLQVLIGRARSILERDYDRQRINHHTEVIIAQGERIVGIVEQLLGYARQRQPENTETDLGKLVRSVVDFLDIEAQKAQVTMTVSIDFNLPLIVCNPSNIQQMTLNLLRNALASTSSGGQIAVRVGTATYNDAEADSEMPSIFLEISDTGYGIPEENLPHIFEPFFTTRADDKGTGLGLAVVKRVVDSHGGRIKVTSVVDAGTTFRIDLPLNSMSLEMKEQF